MEPATRPSRTDAQRAFRLLWAGQAVSQFGTLAGRAALSFAAISTLGASPYELAMLGAVEHVSAIVGAAVATGVADRRRRRPLMIGADAARAVLTLAVPVLAFAGVLAFPHLVVVAALVGALSVVFDVACGAYLPTIVPPDRLVQANARLAASASVAEVAGFGIAGWLVQWLTAPVAIAVDGLSFVVSAISLWGIRVPESAPSHGAAAAGDRGAGGRLGVLVRRSLGDARVGLRTIADHPVLRTQFGVFLLDGVAGGIASVTIVLYMIRGIGFEPGVLTTIWAIGGVTSLGGAAMARRLVTRLGAGRTMTLGLATTGLGTLLVPMASAPDVAGAALLVLNQVIVDPGATAYRITADSLRQALVPNEAMGRVGAVTHFAVSVVTIAGMGLGGLLADTLGMRVAVATSGLCALAAAGLLAAGPAGRVGTITLRDE